MAALAFSLEPYQILSYFLTLGLFGLLLLRTIKNARYTRTLFAGLGVWAVAHLAGMAVQLDGTPLYSHILITLSDSLPILRYDQVVHMFGFGVSTLLIYEVIGHRLKSIDKFSLGLVVLMGGLGIGAMNEIFEFAVSRLVPDSNVGAYENTSLDLVADLIGGLLALVIAFNREKLRRK